MKKLFCGNLPFACDDLDIAAFFRSHGIEATDCKVIRDRSTGDSKGFGFAIVQDADAERALDLSGKDMEVDGRRRQLTINEAREVARR